MKHRTHFQRFGPIDVSLLGGELWIAHRRSERYGWRIAVTRGRLHRSFSERNGYKIGPARAHIAGFDFAYYDPRHDRPSRVAA